MPSLVHALFNQIDILCRSCNFVFLCRVLRFRNLVVEDFMPSGLEADVLDGAGDVNVLSEDFGKVWFPKPCADRSIDGKQGKVTWYCRHLFPGTYNLQYRVTANLPGIYAIPTAFAYPEDHPGVMGMSGGSAAAFVVKGTGGSLTQWFARNAVNLNVSLRS